MALGHASAAAAGEQAHVDKAHHRPAVERAPHILVALGGVHPARRPALAIGPEQQPSGLSGEAAPWKVAPAVPARIIGVLASAIGQPRRLIAQAARSAISFLVSAIALAGFSPFGQ